MAVVYAKIVAILSAIKNGAIEKMYICGDCYKIFGKPNKINVTYEGEPNYKNEIEVCPYCESNCFAKTPKCEICGQYIQTEAFVKLDNNEYICSNCYVQHDIDDLFNKPEYF